MKLVFNVNLSVEELSAFIKNFNKDNSDGENINCAAFLVSFFRAGFQERTNRLHNLWKEKKRVEEARRQKELQEKKEQEMKNALKVNFEFTEADKERAIIKLRTAARLYDKTTPGAMSMKAFEVKEMAPHVFKEQLKRIFNLQVTPPEMGALMAVFDGKYFLLWCDISCHHFALNCSIVITVNGDGVITCEEFTKVFLHMGFVEREKELKEAIEKQKRADARRLQLEEEKRKALEGKNGLKVSYAYTEEEMQSAMRKLTEAAWRYDKLMPGAPCLDAFEKQFMEPHVLKDQLKKAFYMKVTPQELGAIVHYFDTNNSGTIDCEYFLKKFMKTGFDERQRQKAEWREHQKQILETQEQQRAVKQKEKDDRLAFAGLDHSYTEIDFQTAFQKLTTGAMKYDRSGPGAVGLDAFEAVSMPPHVFKEQLKLVFNVNVTLPELWALVAYFDRERTGVVNCKHFLTQFLRTGMDERIRIRQGWRKEEVLKREKDRQSELEKEAEKARRAWAEVDFEFLEGDFDSMLAKLVDMCFNFDRRQLGPAGLTAFEVDSLNPSEFREMLKRTFNLKLTSRELGAMVTYFDSRGKKVADCAMFLNAVVQIRVQCEEFKVLKLTYDTFYIGLTKWHHFVGMC
jgi:Ca2+-binding EF-hand superfamily protein